MNDMIVDGLSQKQAEDISGFLSEVCGINVLRADDLLEGVNGFVAFYGAGEDEKSIWLRWRFAKTVESMETFGLKDERLTKAIECLKDCLIGEGWVKCDDPKRLQVGFAQFANVDSSDSSRAVMFHVGIIKQMPDDVRRMFDKWREERSNLKVVELEEIKRHKATLQAIDTAS